MTSNNGKSVPNQLIITDGNKEVFQSYSSIIAVRENGKLTFDEEKWNYSSTTSKYRNQFTGLDTKETEKKIKSGEIKFADLNK